MDAEAGGEARGGQEGAAALKRSSSTASTGRTGPSYGCSRSIRLATDARGTILSVEPTVTDVLGWAPAEIVGRRVGALVHKDDLPRGLASWAKLIREPDSPHEGVRLRYRHKGGRWIWMDVVNRNRLVDPKHGDVESQLVDVSGEMAALDEVRTRERLLEQITDMAGIGVFRVGTDGRLLYTNGRLTEMTQVQGAAMLGEQLARVAETDRPRLRAAIQGATGGADTAVVIGSTTQSGEHRLWSLSLRPERDPEGAVTSITGCLQDVTGMGALPNAERARATTDPLTGCLTREATLAALDGLVARHRASRTKEEKAWPLRRGKASRGTAVLVIDIDGLEQLNERHGRAAGDELLTLVALRIVDSVRASDVVGRVGGDEFAVLCSGVPGPTTALTIGRSTLEQVCHPMELKSAGRVSVGARMGVAWTNRSDVPAARLLRQADEAMVASKLAGSREPVLAQTSTR